MDGPSVDDAALKPPGQTTVTPRSSADSTLDCLGEIEINGERALVVWPQMGDAVAVDFKADGHRYGLVSLLNTDLPQLLPNPLTSRQITEEQQARVLDAVCALWDGRISNG